MAYKVRELSKLAGISPRTLHHYDHIGLLKPSSVNESRYRLYEDKDLERLQQILFLKELGFKLSEIKEILDDPKYGRERALKEQKNLLILKRKRLDNIIASIDTTLNTMKGVETMKKQDMFNVFDMNEINKHKDEYAKEVREKYDSSIVEECNKKTKSYTKNKWEEICSKGNEFFHKLGTLMNKGPEDEEVQELIGAYRQYITDNFYECTIEIFEGLGQLYVTDERFTMNIDKNREGLSKFVKDAIEVYCNNKK
ncbi:MerR family transcriptional regulator [Anaeromicrobium sediminis]|uniref:MerR family transcriptional regulator n=1 Tax=Anaeromicrobium sediminis TaxID=1478221 RepID=A0A267MQN0_9FIRM|nr:MerR family transcriptional regulator [Anaeromicrobium sediminis]PAB61083.1 MerR family transcriptional regulator [Anaeromicrobium sediminis]